MIIFGGNRFPMLYGMVGDAEKVISVVDGLMDSDW